MTHCHMYTQPKWSLLHLPTLLYPILEPDSGSTKKKKKSDEAILHMKEVNDR